MYHNVVDLIGGERYAMIVDDCYQYLGYKLFSRHCDICKDFRLEIPVIHSRNMFVPS